MRLAREKYFNPFTDFGFKKIFGEEPNKALLIDFLNELLRDEERAIVDIEYLKDEQMGHSRAARRAVFDIHCRNQDGEHFIVEMQKTRQKYFKDRSLYYATFPIRSQGRMHGRAASEACDQAELPGDWDFQLQRVYMVAILDFVFDEDAHEPEKFRYNVKLTDIDTHKVFYDKLSFIYLEMPKFNKGLPDLASHFDKWLYALKNMPTLDEVPAALQEAVFLQLFRTAEIAQFNEAEYRAYHDSLKVYRDNANTFNYAIEQADRQGHERGLEAGRAEGLQAGRAEGLEAGRAEGLEAGRAEGLQAGRAEGLEAGRAEERRSNAREMIAAGITLDTVSRITGLSLEELHHLARGDS